MSQLLIAVENGHVNQFKNRQLSDIRVDGMCIDVKKKINSVIFYAPALKEEGAYRFALVVSTN